jgi:hypothetical protein
MLNNLSSMETNKGKGINRMNGKMIFKFAAVAAIVCVASAARVYAAATVTLAADDMVYFGLANGNALPAGDAVYVGQFSISDAAIAALESGGNVSAANYATLVSDFVPLSVTSIGTIGTASDGDAGAIDATYSGANTAFANGAIYAFVVNTATTAGASQVGVFKGDTTWIYPANMTGNGSVSIDTDNALTAPLIGAYAGSVNASAKGYAYDVDSGKI